MPRPTRVQITRDSRKDGSVTFGLRIRAAGADEHVALGNSGEGWDEVRVEAARKQLLAKIERACGRPNRRTGIVEATQRSQQCGSSPPTGWPQDTQPGHHDGDHRQEQVATQAVPAAVLRRAPSIGDHRQHDQGLPRADPQGERSDPRSRSERPTAARRANRAAAAHARQRLDQHDAADARADPG